MSGLRGASERASVSANLVAALTRRHGRTLLVDLDPKGLATEQVFNRQVPKSEGLSGVLAEQTSLREALLPLAIAVYSEMGTVVRREKIHVLPPGKGIEAIRRRPADQVHGELAALLSSLRRTFDFVVVDSPPPSDPLGKVGVLIADQVIVPLPCGPDSENEVRHSHREISLVKAGLGGKSVLYCLLGTGSPSPLVREGRRRLESLLEPDEEGQPSRYGRLLSSEVGHDPRVYAAQGLEISIRQDWLRVAEEVVSLR